MRPPSLTIRTAIVLAATAAFSAPPATASERGAVSVAELGQPSFDCGKASTAAEKIICQSRELSALDGQMGAMFRQVRSAASADQRERILAEQRSWIARRDRSCGLDRNTVLRDAAAAQIENCFAAAFRERFAALVKDLSAHPVEPPPAARLSETLRKNEQTGDGAAGRLIQTRCHMDYCSWMRVVEKSIVKSSESGSLVKIGFLYGSSHHPGGNYEQRRPIQWDQPAEGFVFCSKANPAVIFKTREGGWLATTLAPGWPDGVFGYNISDTIEYFYVCHDLTLVEEELAKNTGLARKFDYPHSLVAQLTQIPIQSPIAIMNVQRASATLAQAANASDEARFVAAIKMARDAYNQATTEFLKGAARPERAKVTCSAIKSMQVNDWIGKVRTLSTNGDGKGVLSVEIAPGIYVTTWNNAVSDIGSNTLVEPNSPVFSEMGKLKERDSVKFSGTFLTSKVDCVAETSLTLRGSMSSPEFLFRFSNVERY